MCVKLSFAQAMKNGPQAANERFFDLPEIRLICRFQIYFKSYLFIAKKILSGGEAVFHRAPVAVLLRM
jgi:hypothetical protein